MTKPAVRRREASSELTSQKRLAALASLSSQLARLVARNRSAPADLLAILGSHSDATVRKWVASHPNTPPTVLAKLGTQFPDQLLDNPILDVLLLENPNILKELPIGTRRSLLKRENCPASLLEWLAQEEDEGIQLALAMNPNAPAHVLRKLGECKSEKVINAARGHVNYPTARKRGQRSLEDGIKATVFGEALTRSQLKATRILLPWVTAHGPTVRQISPVLSGWVRHQLWRAVAGAPCVPKTAFHSLAKDRDKSVRLAVAGNPCTPPAILEKLSREGEQVVLETVAGNPGTPPSVLRYLSKGKQALRRIVAENPATPADLLSELANDESNWMRFIVAGNRTTPAGLLRRLSESEDEHVRWCVATHRSTPAVILRQLAADRDRSVREAVAGNSSTPKALLRELATSESRALRREVAGNPSTPTNVLRQLSVDKDRNVRSQVARNASTPATELWSLAVNNSARIRMDVASNPSASSGLLENLASERDREIVWRVSANPSATGDVLERLSLDCDASVRSQIARNPSTAETVLELLARDPNQLVREGVVLNRSTPQALLDELVDDKALTVRRAINHLECENLARLSSEELTRTIALTDLPKSERSAKRKALANAFVSKFGRSNKPSFKRLMCLLLPDCPIPVLAKSVRSADWKERMAIASHPKTPPSIRKQLANDGHKFVRKAAHERWAKEA